MVKTAVISNNWIKTCDSLEVSMHRPFMGICRVDKMIANFENAKFLLMIKEYRSR